ncbi:MAG: TldD/PmbA family protein, partial [Methanoregulaceae archaeon]|nr:TldD/PmbA family protein [Methanoregulaceae archaeon]
MELKPIDEILAAGSRKADEVEVFFLEGSSVSATLKRKAVGNAAGSRSAGLSIRVISGGRIGISSTSNPAAWEKCLDAALASARISTPQEWKGLPEQAAIATGDLSFDPDVHPDAPVAREILASMIEGSSAHPAEVTSGSANIAEETEFLANSHGVRYHSRSTGVSASLEAISGQSTGSEFGQSFRMDLDPRAIGEQAAFFASHSKDGKEVRTGTYDVILSPSALSQLLGYVFMPAVSGRNVHAGRSRLADALGTPVMDEGLSLTDDPFSPRGLGSTYWDGEGIPTRRIEIVSDGMLMTFLYDLKTAYRYGKESTGSAVRGGYGGAPSIGHHNLILDGPRRNIRDERAIYVHDVVGAHTANPMSGDFSVECSNPIWVEGGEYQEPVRKAMLSGN